MIENYSRVELLTDKYLAEGAHKGSTGSVIEVYDDGDYEVEFADEKGIDYAQIVAREEELQVLQPQVRASAVPFDITVVEITEISPSTAAPQRVRQPSLK